MSAPFSPPPPPRRQQRQPFITHFLYNILPYVDARTLLECSRISRTWQVEADAMALWRPHVERRERSESEANSASNVVSPSSLVGGPSGAVLIGTPATASLAYSGMSTQEMKLYTLKGKRPTARHPKFSVVAAVVAAQTSASVGTLTPSDSVTGSFYGAGGMSNYSNAHHHHFYSSQRGSFNRQSGTLGSNGASVMLGDYGIGLSGVVLGRNGTLLASPGDAAAAVLTPFPATSPTTQCRSFVSILSEPHERCATEKSQTPKRSLPTPPHWRSSSLIPKNAADTDAPASFSKGLSFPTTRVQQSPSRLAVQGQQTSSCCFKQEQRHRYTSHVPAPTVPPLSFGYTLATPQELLNHRVRIARRDLDSIASRLEAEESTLREERHACLGLSSYLPSEDLLVFHMRCKSHVRLLCHFEEYMVQLVVAEARKRAEEEEGATTTEAQLDGESKLTVAQRTRVANRFSAFSPLRSFVQLEMALMLAPSSSSLKFVSEAWAEVKRSFPIDDAYYDYMELIQKWGPEWSFATSTDGKLAENRRDLEAMHEASETLRTVHGTLEAKVHTITHPCTPGERTYAFKSILVK